MFDFGINALQNFREKKMTKHVEKILWRGIHLQDPMTTKTKKPSTMGPTG
jgi:hypothetical protein